MLTTMIKLAVRLAFSLFVFTMPTWAFAAGPTLTVSGDGGLQVFDRDALLARSDVVEITTSRDVAYRTPQTYRAVALAKLFEGVDVPPDAVVEAAAQDGFVTQLPRDLVYSNDGIRGYVASKLPANRGHRFRVRRGALAPSISFGLVLKRHPSQS